MESIINELVEEFNWDIIPARTLCVASDEIFDAIVLLYFQLESTVDLGRLLYVLKEMYNKGSDCVREAKKIMESGIKAGRLVQLLGPDTMYFIMNKLDEEGIEALFTLAFIPRTFLPNILNVLVSLFNSKERGEEVLDVVAELKGKSLHLFM